MCNSNSWQGPQWLTNVYLEKVLREYLQDDTVQIQKIEIKPATENGENYASVMNRIRIISNSERANSLQDISFIIKYPYETDAFILKLMKDYELYNTEMKMYEQILPQLAKILKESGDTDKLFANTLKVDYERSTIIFEDLSVHDYVMADRKKGLDETHARLVMRKLAKYHAAAAVLNERTNGSLENFDHGMFNRHTRSQGCIFEYFLEEAAKFAKDCPTLGQYYCDKLTKLSSHIVDYGIASYASNPNHFNTLCHGDLWVNNMMMLYDQTTKKEKPLQDLMLIDFQLSNWSTAAVDLHYFFNTSLEAKLLMDLSFQEKLVQYYHSVLSEMFIKLKYSGHIPTLHELCVQLEESRILAVTGIIANRTIATADQCDDADIYCLVGDDERAKKFRRNCYKNENVQMVLRKMLPYFDRRGLLDLKQK